MSELSVILAIFAILLTAISQILLKIGAHPSGTYPWVPLSLKPYFNWHTILGYGILLIVTVLSIFILQDMPLKVFFPVFISGNLIAIEVLSKIFLHESFTSRKIIGICMILSGILIFPI